MTAKLWRSKIKRACNAAGCYQKSFDITIALLADVLERRDEILNEFDNTGREYVKEYTNKGGATNEIVNPLLTKLEKHEELANKYLNDLGLTAKSLKSLGTALDKKEDGSFESLLEQIGI